MTKLTPNRNEEKFAHRCLLAPFSLASEPQIDSNDTSSRSREARTGRTRILLRANRRRDDFSEPKGKASQRLRRISEAHKGWSITWTEIVRSCSATQSPCFRLAAIAQNDLMADAQTIVMAGTETAHTLNARCHVARSELSLPESCNTRTQHIKHSGFRRRSAAIQRTRAAIQRAKSDHRLAHATGGARA